MTQISSLDQPTKSGRTRWILSLVLVLPALFPYFSHYRYAWAHGLIPTGFLIRDMPYYMSNARAHFAGGYFHLFYALPFSPNDDSPQIYFQPHVLLLGLIWRFSNLEIDTVFLIFSAVAAVVCARVAVALYEFLVGLDTKAKRIALPLFFWGGGVIVLAGLGKLLVVGAGADPMELERLFDFDPFRGWWFLDFGRNLLFGTEAYYHALFFGAVLLAMQRRYIASALAALVLSSSHPFTGIELLGVLSAWIAVERVILRSRVIPTRFMAAIGLTLLLHLAYYLWFLPSISPEHASVAQAWESAFILSWRGLVAGHILVFALAVWTVHTDARWRAYFASPSARLLTTWFIVALAMANHDLFLSPVQPLHFTRGYIWTPLFFMGAPSLVGLIDYLLKKRLLGMIAIGGVACIMLLDNALWLSTMKWRPDVVTDGVMISPPRWEVLEELRKPQYEGALVLSRDLDLGYLVTAYTPLRSWYSHWANTPYRDERKEELAALFNSGSYLDAWRRRKIVVVLKKELTPQTPGWLKDLNGQATMENDQFRIYLVDPAKPS